MVLKNKNNPNWKGDRVGYDTIHRWVKRYKIKSEFCEICKKDKRLELSNISGDYKRDLEDWQWICHKCHQIGHAEKKFVNIKYKQYISERKKYPDSKREYYNQNAEMLTRIRKERYQENRKEVLRKAKEYQKENREYIIKYKKRHYQKIKETHCAKVRAYRKNEKYDRTKQNALNIIRDKYKEEFNLILHNLAEENYKKKYRKAQKLLKNNHRYEFLETLKTIRR